MEAIKYRGNEKPTVCVIKEKERPRLIFDIAVGDGDRIKCCFEIVHKHYCGDEKK